MAAPIQPKANIALDGSGNGTATFNGPRVSHVWLIERISIEITGGSAANLGGEARVFVGGEYRDGTATPWLDVSEYSGGPLRVFAGMTLEVQFSSCGANRIASVRIEGTEVRGRLA